MGDLAGLRDLGGDVENAADQPIDRDAGREDAVGIEGRQPAPLEIAAIA